MKFVTWTKDKMRALAELAITTKAGNYRFTFRGVGLFGLYIGILDGRLTEKPKRK